MDRAIKLPPSRINDAALLLSRAFHDDPMTVFLYPDGKDIPYPFYSLNIEHALTSGEAFTTELFKGIAIWRIFEKDNKISNKVTPDPRLKIPGFLGESAFQKLMLVSKATNSLHRSSVKGAHFYLFFLAVEQGQQWKGTGSMLIQPMLQIADNKQVPCYLETMEEKNLKFYAKHGFNVCNEAQVAENGPHIWGLLRRPNTSVSERISQAS